MPAGPEEERAELESTLSDLFALARAELQQLYAEAQSTIEVSRREAEQVLILARSSAAALVEAALAEAEGIRSAAASTGPVPVDAARAREQLDLLHTSIAGVAAGAERVVSLAGASLEKGGDQALELDLAAARLASAVADIVHALEALSGGEEETPAPRAPSLGRGPRSSRRR